MASSNTHFFWLNRVPFNPYVWSTSHFGDEMRQNAAILEHVFRESRHLLLQLGSPSPKLVRSHYMKILT